MLEQILDLRLEHYCGGATVEDDFVDEDESAYETSTHLIKYDNEYIKGTFISIYEPEWLTSDIQGLTIREYLDTDKSNKVVFCEHEGESSIIEMEDLHKIEYITLLEDSSFLPLAIKKDDGQPMRAMMHFIYDEMAKSEMKDEEFIDYLQASARQIQESMKADKLNNDY